MEIHVVVSRHARGWVTGEAEEGAARAHERVDLPLVMQVHLRERGAGGQREGQLRAS